MISNVHKSHHYTRKYRKDSMRTVKIALVFCTLALIAMPLLTLVYFIQ